MDQQPQSNVAETTDERPLVRPVIEKASEQPPYVSAPTIPAVAEPAAEVSTHDYVIAVTLSTLVGFLGIDRFYLGYYVSGTLKLLTFGGFGIWYIIDAGRIVSGRMLAKNDSAPLANMARYKSFFVTVSTVTTLVLVIPLVGLVIGAVAFLSQAKGLLGGFDGAGGSGSSDSSQCSSTSADASCSSNLLDDMTRGLE